VCANLGQNDLIVVYVKKKSAIADRIVYPLILHDEMMILIWCLAVLLILCMHFLISLARRDALVTPCVYHYLLPDMLTSVATSTCIFKAYC
jgi:hypothetical protein